MTEELATLVYRAGDRDFEAPVFGRPASPAPGIVVFHEGMGRSDHEIAAARQLGDAGYVAMAADIFGEPIISREHGMASIIALIGDPDRLRGRAAAALAALAAHPAVDRTKLGAIGFCFGGTAALELARTGADLRAVVDFHGGLNTARPATPSAVKARLLACVGSDDPVIPAAQRADFEAEMTAAKADWQILLLGGVGHSFTNDAVPANLPGFAYDRHAHRRSWQAMEHHFDECFATDR